MWKEYCQLLDLCGWFYFHASSSMLPVSACIPLWSVALSMAFQALEEKETNTMFLHFYILGFFLLIATTIEIYVKKSTSLTNSKHCMLEKLSWNTYSFWLTSKLLLLLFLSETKISSLISLTFHIMYSYLSELWKGYIV